MKPDAHSASKKRKHAKTDPDAAVDGPVPKKPKRDGKKSKAKSIVPASEFRTVDSETVVSIPPAYAFDADTCVHEMLDSMLMRYMPSLEGVLLAHSDVKFVQDQAVILGACPFAVATVAFRALVWGPSIGMKLKGRISLCSPDHISLLVHHTFNVSIPRHHIPVEEYDFIWATPDNAPPLDDETEPAPAAEDLPLQQLSKDVDHWAHRETGDLIGDEDGCLEFTVIGLKLANHMLSLVASIQPDPFSADHVPDSVLEERAQAQAQAEAEAARRAAEAEPEAAAELAPDAEEAAMNLDPPAQESKKRRKKKVKTEEGEGEGEIKPKKKRKKEADS